MFQNLVREKGEAGAQEQRCRQGPNRGEELEFAPQGCGKSLTKFTVEE